LKEKAVRRPIPVWLFQTQQVLSQLDFFCSNTVPMKDGLYWNSRVKELELTEISSLNIVSLV
jgi:hypothetical protein